MLFRDGSWLREKLRGRFPLPVKRAHRWCVRTLRRLFVLPVRRWFGRRIPVAMVTGSKGKTTTTRMVARILREAGHKVGFTCTTGIVIGDDYVLYEDSSGYPGAATVLADPSVTAAVLETARGGLLRTGPYLDRCDSAALLNIGDEQLGMDGVDTRDHMVKVKRRVVDCGKDAVVLNADDPLCVELIPRYPRKRVVLFSRDPDNEVTRKHVERGGRAYVLAHGPDGDIIERRNADVRPVIRIKDLQSCRDGLFPQNIANAMAAAALAEGMGIPLETVSRGLSKFESSVEECPGRLNIIDGYRQTILLDVAANPPACKELVESLKALDVKGRRFCVFSAATDRDDDFYRQVARILAPHFDIFICYERTSRLFDREPKSFTALLVDCFERAGVPKDRIHAEYEYEGATCRLAELTREGDFAFIVMGNHREFMPQFRENFARHRLEE